jgi:uncharacterized SAM-binding protein YcdF (DUF218 family)
MIDIIVSVLVYPLGLSISFAIASIFLRIIGRNFYAGFISSIAVFWLTFWSLPPVSYSVSSLLERHSLSIGIDNIPNADVILVYGGVMKPTFPGYYFPDLGSAADRVWHASRLYHAGKAPLIILSGGRAVSSMELASQAETMKLFLVDLGVPESAILLEVNSNNTYENALYSSQVLSALGLDSVLLVTSALHMRRSLAVSQAAGINALPIATDFEAYPPEANFLSWLPSSGALNRSTLALHEWFGLLAYRIRGWL